MRLGRGKKSHDGCDGPDYCWVWFGDWYLLFGWVFFGGLV